MPDFGFNESLSFDESQECGWNTFMDCVSIMPKCERVRNYIDFIHKKKIEILQRKVKRKKTKEETPQRGLEANEKAQKRL